MAISGIGAVVMMDGVLAPIGTNQRNSAAVVTYWEREAFPSASLKLLCQALSPLLSRD